VETAGGLSSNAAPFILNCSCPVRQAPPNVFNDFNKAMAEAGGTSFHFYRLFLYPKLGLLMTRRLM
jgi:hypothetical protein